MVQEAEILEQYEAAEEAPDGRALFKCMDLHGQRFVEMTLLCADWIECDLSGVIFEDCDLRGSDFRDSNLTAARFERCSIDGCEFPEDSSIELVDSIETLRD